MSLRTKLILSVCGPLVILVTVGVMSLRSFAESSRAIEGIFRENYDSTAACLGIKRDIETLNHGAEYLLWNQGGPVTQAPSEIFADLEKHLAFQRGNVTLTGEQELTDRLTALWTTYKREYTDFLASGNVEAERRRIFIEQIAPTSRELRDTAQQIADLNLNNMVSVDGQVRRHFDSVWHAVAILVLSGMLLSGVFIAIIGPSIVRPISGLIHSVREIEKGNLELVVKPHGRDEIGQLAKAFNGMATSLREFRRMDRARLMRTRQTTQLVLDTLPDAVAVCDLGGTVEVANEKARALFGLEPEQALPSAENTRFSDLFAQALKELRPVRPRGADSLIQTFGEGREGFYLPQAIPILDANREALGVTLVITNVTAMRQVDEAKSGLISTVSHELKTPLTSIRLAVHVLLSEKLGPLTPKQAEIVTAARDDADRLHRIIENLLDISRLESQHEPASRLLTDMEDVVLHACEDARAAYLNRGVTLKTELPGHLPLVHGDALRLGSVIGNLLSNALKYTPPGGRVDVRAEEAGEGDVRITVEDTGSGIPEEYLPHVFEKFFRVPGREQRGDSGLGLAIVKEIIEAHGGSVQVASVPGKGTRFIFTLPGAAKASTPSAGDRTTPV